MGSRKHRWKISIYRKTPELNVAKPPAEFVCPISGSVMADPVIVSTGQTFERACVTACKTIGFTPTLNDCSTPDFSVVIPNLALKASITSWARVHNSDPPHPVRLTEALKLVMAAMKRVEASSSGELMKRVEEEEVEVGPAALRQVESESGESWGRTPLVLATRPSCYSSGSSSSEFEMGTFEEEGFVWRMRSPHVFEEEEGVVALRKVTRSSDESRITLCTPKLLSALRSLISSKYTDIQVNAVAALVNLSLEKTNKVKIVRAGFVPPLVDVLRGRFAESQEHACGALFSLALDDENKTAIGVLGALQPLIHMMMRSESERARHDAALALYHLSLVQSNRSKLVKLGSVQLFLNMVKSDQMPGRALLILCNLGACSEGRAAMLDADAVAFFVDLLKGEFDSESTRESCVAAICALSNGGGLRFRGLAKAAGAMEVLKEVVEKSGRERARDKARRVLEMLKAREEEEEEEEVDWEKVLEFGFPIKTVTLQTGQACQNSN